MRPIRPKRFGKNKIVTRAIASGNLKPIAPPTRHQKHYNRADMRTSHHHSFFLMSPMSTWISELLISLYAGFISEACGSLLRIGGILLVNSSPGDAALAALDPRFALTAVVTSTSGQYKIENQELDQFLIPKNPQTITHKSVKESRRGIAYTKSPFAYLFSRVV